MWFKSRVVVVVEGACERGCCGASSVVVVGAYGCRLDHV